MIDRPEIERQLEIDRPEKERQLEIDRSEIETPLEIDSQKTETARDRQLGGRDSWRQTSRRQRQLEIDS